MWSFPRFDSCNLCPLCYYGGMPLAIRVENLKKSFVSQTRGLGKVQALDGVTLDIYEGEILGILGPNGAGKTTFLNILSTLLLPDSGTVTILGIQSTPKNYYRLRKLLNMSSGYPNYPWSLTIEENLRFYGRLYGLAAKPLSERTAELIEMFGLQEFAKRRFDEVSSGIKQRLSLAKSLINCPKILFLDEPTVGLDPDAALKTREIILNILKRSKITVIFTTHNMQEAEHVCRRIAFIKQGRILALASPQELKKVRGRKDLEEVFIDLAQGKPDGQYNTKDPLSDHSVMSVPSEAQRRIPLLELVAAWLNRSLAFACRNFLFAVRNVFAFVELVFWPIVSLLSIGLMGDFLELEEKALGFVLTGALAGGILQVTQLDVAYSLLYEVWSKSMKHTLLAPVGISEQLFGSWMVGIVRGCIIFLVLGLSAMSLFGFHFPPIGVTIVFLFGIFSFALLLGLLVSILILIYGQKAEITAWMFAYVFMLLCGIYYPIDTLPRFFYNLAKLIPMTYFLEYFRMSFGFQPDFEHLLLKGFGLFFLYLVAGLIMMKFAFYAARKKGIIVRLSE